MTQPDSIGLRISIYFAALYTVPGIHLPFWSVWLESRGLDPTQISIMLSSAILLRLIGSPLAAQAVDRSGQRRRAIILLGWCSFFVFIGFQFADGFAALFIVGMLFALLWSPISPFTENLAVLAASHHGLQYGRMRLWGSLSFLIASYLAGLWLREHDEAWIYWLMLMGMFGIACSGHLLPDVRLPLSGPRKGAPVLRLLRNSSFRVFLLTTSCLQATHAAVYTFGTLHWRSAGLSDAQIGLLWAEGVLAEVVLFAFGQRVAARIGGVGLLWCAVIGGSLRWSLQGVLTDMPSVVLLQILHAATFGAAHLGAMRLLAEGCDAESSASAQSLYGAANGLVLAAATLLVGPLYAAALPGFGAGWIYPAMLPLVLVGGLGSWILWRFQGQVSFRA